MLEWLGDLNGATVLEIGTGWQPLIPILFSLAGAKVYTADLNHLMRLDSFCAALDSIGENRQEIVQRVPAITTEAVEDAIRECHDMEQRLIELRVVYKAPCDCRKMLLDSGSIDVVTSRSVLEHVPRPVIEDILREAKRLLRPGGRMMHIIDNSDHWSHRDKSITAVNFLQYSDRMFNLTCINSLNYTNRIRHSEYLSMLRATGFQLMREEGTVNPDCLKALPGLRLAERFRHLQPEDLATTTSLLLAEVPIPAAVNPVQAPQTPATGMAVSHTHAAVA